MTQYLSHMDHATRLSKGFATGETRSLDALEREIEYRLGNMELGTVVTTDKDQQENDDLDEAMGKYQAQVKNPDEQFPGAKTLDRLSAGVDEGLWNKAKDASQQAFGRIKWPFVNWWYEHHGGK